MEGNTSQNESLLHSCNTTSTAYNDCVSALMFPTSCSFAKTSFVVLLSAITVLANAVLLHLLRTNKALKTTSNLYIVSLAISDLMVGLVVIPLNLLDICYPWDASLWTHGLWVTADFFFTSESILHYVLFNLDRYWSINAPFKYIRRRSRRKTIMHIAGTWGIGVVMILSPAVTWRFGFSNLIVSSKTAFAQFKKSSWLMCTNAIIIYFTPLLVLCAIYCKIFRTLSRRTKLGIGRSSVTSTVFSKSNSRRASESVNTSPSPFITESDLIRLRVIYDQALKRERTARHQKMMFPLRKRQFTSPGADIQHYDSIEEEDDDTQEQEESIPLNFGQINQRNGDIPTIKYTRKLYDNQLNEPTKWTKEVTNNEYVAPFNNEDDEVFESPSTDGEKQVKDICTCELSMPTYDDPRKVARPRSYPSVVAHRVSTANKSCSGDLPKPLKMAKVEQIKTFGGIVCPNCSKIFADIGMIKHEDLQDYVTAKHSSGSGSSNYEHSTSVSSSEDDRRDVLLELLPHDPNLNRVDNLSDQIRDQRKGNSNETKTGQHPMSGRVPLVNGIVRTKDTTVNFQIVRSRRNSCPSINTSLDHAQHRNSVGEIKNRVRQSFQNSFSAISGKSSRALNILRQQEKAVKQLAITLACMFICWTPYFSQVLIYSFSPGSANYTILKYAVYLGYFHSFCNPVLIIIFNVKMQRAFKKAFCCYHPEDKKREYIHPCPSAL